MQSTIVSWQVYEITNSKFALGLIGLSEALPFILSTFYSGYVADKFNRKKILVGFTWLLALCSSFLVLINVFGNSLLNNYGAVPIYIIIAISGVARAFIAPTTQAIQARIIPRGMYANAATWSSNVFQFGAVIGPLIGGFIFEQTNAIVLYSIVVCFIVLSAILKSKISDQPISSEVKHESFFKSLNEGLRFSFKTEQIASSISLDLFAVLFGGVVALLPAFCIDILHVGPTAMGFLRASQFLGSAMMGVFLAYHPPLKNAGRNLLLSVSMFGFCIIGFALSEYYWLSFILLMSAGAFDNVSVIIRSTILQLYTPDAMRGRVNSVNAIFIKSSNEIGDFESGVAASFLGLVPAVIFGGSMTLFVVAMTFLIAKNLRTLDLTKDPEELIINS
jgi:MFS family permease